MSLIQHTNERSTIIVAPTIELAVDRRSATYRPSTQPRRVERLERRIADARMRAAVGMDWEQLHIRSRALGEQIARASDPAGQIAVARRMRRKLLDSNDAFGLRALRLATAAPMAGWLQVRPLRAQARALSQELETDRRTAVPELDSLERQLRSARGRLG